MAASSHLHVALTPPAHLKQKLNFEQFHASICRAYKWQLRSSLSESLWWGSVYRTTFTVHTCEQRFLKLCCIVDGYCCCVIDWHCFLLRDCFFFNINFITLHAPPLLWSNTTCIEVNFYILSSTIYLFHLQFWFLVYFVIFTHWTLSNNMLFANSLKFL